MSAYYNDNDPFVCQWLRNLIAAGHIAPGEVDERSIVDVAADDLRGFRQCHFFAGIGGWSYALRLAGWPDDREVWTGSCPCQPFSVAGAKQGHTDERHLWPALYGHIVERRPATIFGEQVASALGLEWMSAVRADLEETAYAVGVANLPAICVGAPHIRERLVWVADATRSWRCWGSEMAQRQRSQLGGPSSHLLHDPWPDGRGSGSALNIADICAPSYGIPGRVGMLRGYGNAIVPQVAAEFIRAVMECMP